MMRAASRSAASQIAWPWGCALLAIALYLPSLGASFQFDDWAVIVSDPRVGSLSAWLHSMPGIRPVLKFTYAVNNELGAAPSQFRAVNIAVHAINTALVYLLLATLGEKLNRGSPLARRAALGATLLFALHPVQTEAVTYICGRSSSLSASFALGSLLAWTKAVDSRRPWPGVLLSVTLFALGLGTKETVVVLPLALALWSTVTRSVGNTSQNPSWWQRDKFVWIGPHAVLAIAALLVAVSWPAYQRLLQASLHTRGIGTNLLTQSDAIFWLLGQLLMLAPINPDPALGAADISHYTSWLHAAIVAAAIAAGFGQLRQRPALSFGVLWFFLWLLPTNSLLPRLDVANDRQLYLALIGPAWLAGLAFARLAQARDTAGSRKRGMAWAVALAAFAGFTAFATMRQNRIYADEVSFWEAVAQRSPASARAADNLGFAYAMACRPSDAAREFERAIRLDPDDVRARVNARLLQEGALLLSSRAKDCAQNLSN